MYVDTYEMYRQVTRGLDTFEVTEDHLKLLRRAYVGWNDMEFGAPSIDPKRPYGNSQVLADIAGIILGLEDYEAQAEYAEQHAEELARLHAETAVALEIALRTGEFRAGTYRLTRYWEWERCDQDSDGEPLIDPDCLDGKCTSCVGGPCEHHCHQTGGAQ